MKFSNASGLHWKGLGIYLADWNDLFQPESILYGGHPSEEIQLSVGYIEVSFVVHCGFMG